ncbi:mitochondrial inner membrane protein OXA1-like [Punica granatum]|uniref:Membrane insertase YidC/Oxa/ALB C-terminal domain-containing protein n=2 Tax=Punica granatum TaxID=22663 RepID=A0A218WBY4_PUNGR|nr:mitochondrial inner membrane protein OXA1-like [Punica granatum]OWM70387.1 hypothetical protein CDL15_Pgr027343 [Punica granatum]PKI40495.1 hypothetical protein CRG98_039131 [Punica granatum]
MAFGRCVSTRGILTARRVHPSCCHIHHHNRDDDSVRSSPCLGPSRSIVTNLLTRCASYSTSRRTGPQFRDRSLLLSASFLGLGSSFCRSMSSASGESSDDGILAEVITERTADVASQVPAMSEVAVAAADSAYPVAALQHLIDGVHSFTGLNWWASIAMTTILIRGATVPLLINQLKSTSKLSMMRPHLEELNQKFKESAMDPDAVAKHKQRVMALFKDFGVSPLTPLKGLFIQSPIFISFFLAINNMAEKVPSFQTGGTLWFIDLTTPDSFYILPILTSLTFWITVECNMQEGMEGNPIAGTMKRFSRIFAVLALPVMMSFPKAIFGYWLTSNVFSLAYGLVIKRPAIKKILNIPDVTVPASPAAHGEISLFAASIRDEASEVKPSISAESSKFVRKISAASVLRQRIRSLEKQVKARKKNRKSLR